MLQKMQETVSMHAILDCKDNLLLARRSKLQARSSNETDLKEEMDV